MNDNYFQNEIASHIGKMLRDAFGKGPQSIYVSVDRPYIVIYLRNFLTPTERILLNQGQQQTIRHTRDIVMSWLVPEIKAYLLVLTGISNLDFYYDWELPYHSGVFVGQWSDENAAIEESAAAEEAREPYAGQEELHRELILMSGRIQKEPEHIDSRQLNKRTLLVVRNGILIDLSKELIRLRDEEHLKEALTRLEKQFVRDNKHVEQILNARIVDVFVDWDFGRDRSVIVLILSP
ncbi:Na-translocating system protein MpsC family protein [Paenibacillus agaridevorans]|uniref:Na-translocating system protein MpsC family protein n=1 Tax=Paenibacillus agaridevorans TaxID=171404 RepID=UPI001BE48F5C|nr:Na-translocating system protein MpsC family protein [Paenibacillus agaridevorans]